MSLPHQGPSRPDQAADAFILAGGRSSRMGQDKALIRINGTPLIQHALELLQSAGLKPRIAGARGDLSTFAPVIPDSPSHLGLGPLSGICAGLDATAARYSVFLPVDLPLLAPLLISYLLHHAQVTASAVTLASIGGFIETFPVVIDRNAAPTLIACLACGDRKCLTAFRSAAAAIARPFSVVPVEFLVQAGQIAGSSGIPPHAWFLSINDPGNLVAAEALKKRHLQLS